MIILETIYRVYDEGMIVEELDEIDENDFQAQELPIYQIESEPIESPSPVH